MWIDLCVDTNGHLDIQSASLLSGSLQLGAAITLIIGSYIADYLRTKKILSIAAVSHNLFYRIKALSKS